MKVGDKVWLFDINRRVYPDGGTMCSSPIYSEHFYQDTIDGETRNSWIIGRTKFSKKNPLGIYTDEQKADRIWEHENRYKIGEKIRYCPTNKLKKINAILEDIKE